MSEAEVDEESEEPEQADDSMVARARQRLEDAGERLSLWSARLRQAVPASDLGWEFFHRFRQNNGTVLAGHIAYRLFVWLAPFMLVLAAGLGFSTSAWDVVGYAQDFGVGTESAQDVADQAEQSRVTVLAIGLPALILASWSLLRGLHYAYSQVWGIEIVARKRTVRGSLVTVLGAILIAAVSLTLARVQTQGPLLAFVGWAGGFVSAIAAFWAVSWFMPRRTNRWTELLPGAVVGAIGLSCLHVFAAVYLPGRVENASVLYGSIGVALAVLFYVFLVAYLLVIPPFVNAVWVDRYEILAGRPWVNDAEAAPRWFRGPLRRFTLRGKLQEGPTEEP